MSATEPTASEIASRGGRARAKSLTKQQRSEIARRAVEARWHGDVPQALCEGEIQFADSFIPCAVLDNETRVLSERGVTKGFGLKRAGSNWRKKNKDGARLPVYASANNLKPFMDNDLRLALMSPILYRPRGTGAIAYGVKADLIPKVCEVWLRARDDGALLPRQLHIAVQADLIMRGLAHIGIIALVDEATGYQDDRPRLALAKILEEFVAEELRKWVKTFPLDYFRELCRIRGVEFRENMRLPSYFGHLTNNLIYSRLAPGVLAKLQEKNPSQDGRRKHKNFQYLTDDVGHPRLLQHLGSIVTLMKLTQSGKNAWRELEATVDKIHKPYRPMPLFDGLEDD